MPSEVAPRSSRSGRPTNRTAMRSKIMAAARIELAEQGPEKISMRAVARRADMPVSSIYRFFADRADLLAALAVDAYTELTDELTQTISASADSRQQFRDVAFALRAWAGRRPASFSLLYSPPHENPVWPAEVRAARARTVHLVGDILERVRADDDRSANNWVGSGVVPSRMSVGVDDPTPPLRRGVLAVTMSVWSSLIGHIGLEGRRSDLVDDPDAHYAEHVEAVLSMINLPGR